MSLFKHFKHFTDDYFNLQPLYHDQTPAPPHERILLLPFTDSGRPTVIQSNYTAIHPKANQTFNSLMVPHSVIGLCSETNKQCTSRPVIPLTATHAESAKLALKQK